MPIRIARFLVINFVLWTTGWMVGQQPLPARVWRLPHGTTVQDSGPRTYRVTVDYDTANTKGEIVRRQRMTGEYTRGLANNQAIWNNVAEASAEGATAPFGASQKRDFMEGFRYRNQIVDTMKPDFFKGFPDTAVFERNLVWDTAMIELFGQNYFEHLELNTPYHLGGDQGIEMPAVGTFHNRDVVLEWIGFSKRNGRDCALIRYEAFFNPLQIVNGGIDLNGRSDYWGEIWVALGTKQIEYATIYEDVMGEMKITGQDGVQNINVFRRGTLEPVNAKQD